MTMMAISVAAFSSSVDVAAAVASIVVGFGFVVLLE